MTDPAFLVASLSPALITCTQSLSGGVAQKSANRLGPGSSFCSRVVHRRQKARQGGEIIRLSRTLDAVVSPMRGDLQVTPDSKWLMGVMAAVNA